MPIYEFKCLECGKISELLIRDSEQAPRCPDCGSGKLEKLMSSSYTVRMSARASDTTCCGRSERCDSPPCANGDVCYR